MSASCPSCASPVDPLRAGHVAIFDDRFFYFCDLACRERVAPLGAAKVGDAPPTPGDVSAQQAPPSMPAGRRSAPRTTGRGADSPSVDRRTNEDALLGAAEASADATPRSPAAEAPALDETATASAPSTSSRLGFRDGREVDAPPELGTILLGSAIALGVLAVSLVLAGVSSTVMVLRYTLCSVGLACIVVHAWRATRDPTDVHPALLLAPGGAACALAVWTFLARDPAAEEAATLPASSSPASPRPSRSSNARGEPWCPNDRTSTACWGPAPSAWQARRKGYPRETPSDPERKSRSKRAAFSASTAT